VCSSDLAAGHNFSQATSEGNVQSYRGTPTDSRAAGRQRWHYTHGCVPQRPDAVWWLKPHWTLADIAKDVEQVL